MDALQAVLLDAAQELETQGWCQFHYCNENDELCLIGALQVAAGADKALLVDAKHAVQLELRNELGNSSIINFNDEQGRSADEVVALLRRTSEAVAR